MNCGLTDGFMRRGGECGRGGDIANKGENKEGGETLTHFQTNNIHCFTLYNTVNIILFLILI